MARVNKADVMRSDSGAICRWIVALDPIQIRTRISVVSSTHSNGAKLLVRRMAKAGAIVASFVVVVGSPEVDCG